MPHYHFNIVDKKGAIPDPEGLELSCISAAKEAARQSIKDMIAATVAENGSIADREFHVTDEAGCVVFVMGFQEWLSKALLTAQEPVLSLLKRAASNTKIRTLPLYRAS